MGTPPPPTDRTRDDDCLSPADRTAFALGELDDLEHAVVARHLLRCARCRVDVDAAASIAARLSAFGRGGDWEADVGAALAAERGRLRVRRRAALVGFASAAAAATLVGALWLGGTTPTRQPLGSDAGPVAESTTPPPPLGTSVERAQLLAAQSSDGRFSAAPSIGGARHDEATTALAVLALLREDGGVPKDAAAARAVAAAVRWLRVRQSPSGRFGPESTSDPRDQALATAALLEVGSATGDAVVRAAAERGVRALRRDVGTAGADAWVTHVMTRARDLATGHASDAAAIPAMADVLVAGAWPAAFPAADSALGRTLAVVERPRRE